MIKPDIIEKIRYSTCAVIRLPKVVSKFIEDLKKGDPTKVYEQAKIMATSFFIDVENGVVLTNRHVVEAMFNDFNLLENVDNWVVGLIYPNPGNKNHILESMASIEGFYILESKRQDLGLLRFGGIEEEGGISNAIKRYKNVEFEDLNKIEVGQDIAICGYPYGSDLLIGVTGIRRYGPVFHEGIISAVSPYNTIDKKKIDSFMTDLSTAGGFSGSPIFIPDSGKVIGIHFAGIEAMLGYAIPLSKEKIDNLVDTFVKEKTEGTVGFKKISINAETFKEEQK